MLTTHIFKQHYFRGYDGDHISTFEFSFSFFSSQLQVELDIENVLVVVVVVVVVVFCTFCTFAHFAHFAHTDIKVHIVTGGLCGAKIKIFSGGAKKKF